MTLEERTIIQNITSLIGTYRGLNSPPEEEPLNQLFLAIEEIISYVLEGDLKDMILRDDEIHISLATDFRTKKRAIDELLSILYKERR